MKLINLTPYSGGTLVIAGRPKGDAARIQFGLPEIDKSDETAKVIIPPEVISLNSSFFLGMFAQSIQTLGEDEFLKKYSFECAPILFEDITSGIRQALNKANPLAPAFA